MNLETALILVDVQNNMFDPSNPVYEADALLERLLKLLQIARASGTRVVFTLTPGWLIHPEFALENGDLILQKHDTDAFAKTDLQARLQQMGIKNLIIAGLQSESCIMTNCKKAQELGFHVTLVADSHSTYPSQTQSAAELIEATNTQLKGVVKFWHVDDVQI